MMTDVTVCEPQDLVLTVDKVATMLGISRGLAYQAIREGSIPAIRIGRRILVPRIALERLLAGHEKG